MFFSSLLCRSVKASSVESLFEIQIVDWILSYLTYNKFSKIFTNGDKIEIVCNY